MPRFDYKCSGCGMLSEQNASDLVVYINHDIHGNQIDDLEVLSKSEMDDVCKGKFKRVYSFGGAILKGPGFYSTDN